MPWRHGNGVLNVNALVNATKLTNPSFETSSLLNHWNNFNASATTIFKNKTYQRSGSQIAHLTPDGYLRKTVKGLKPNTTYQVKMLVGFDNYQGKANIRISNYSNVGSPIYRAFTGSGRTNNLSYIHTTFTTGSANTSAFLQIKNRSTTGTANFYVDEIRLKALSVEGK